MTSGRLVRLRSARRIALPLLLAVGVVLVTAGASGGASNAPWTGTFSYAYTYTGPQEPGNYTASTVSATMTVKLGEKRLNGTYKATFTGHTTVTYTYPGDDGNCGRTGFTAKATYTDQPGTATPSTVGSADQAVWQGTPEPPAVGGDAQSTYVYSPGRCAATPLMRPDDITNFGCVVPLKGITGANLDQQVKTIGRFAYQGSPFTDGLAYCGQSPGSPTTTKYSMTAAYNLVRAGTSAGAPVAAFADTFNAAGQTKPHAVAVPAEKTKAEITLRWTKPGDRFTIADVVLVPKRKTASVARAEKLKITFFSLTPTSMGVRIGNLAPGKLTFRIVSKKQNGTTTVRTRAILKA